VNGRDPLAVRIARSPLGAVAAVAFFAPRAGEEASIVFLTCPPGGGETSAVPLGGAGTFAVGGGTFSVVKLARVDPTVGRTTSVTT